MDTEDKMRKMFIALHGDIDADNSACSTEFRYDPDDWDEDQRPSAIIVMKNGYECWRLNKYDLLFEYLTKDWS